MARPQPVSYNAFGIDYPMINDRISGEPGHCRLWMRDIAVPLLCENLELRGIHARLNQGSELLNRVANNCFFPLVSA